jgi:hypothetical protein
VPLLSCTKNVEPEVSQLASAEVTDLFPLAVEALATHVYAFSPVSALKLE